MKSGRLCGIALTVLLVGCASTERPAVRPAVLDCCLPPKVGDGRLPDPSAARVSGDPAIETQIDDEPAPGTPPKGMVWIPSGRFAMGSDYEPFPDARPVHTVRLRGFYMDVHPVTNAEFAKFVAATGYKTVAERAPDPKQFPGAPKETLVPGSLVFSGEWRYVPGASWRRPEGPESTLTGRESHPVVQVAWDDAVAYAKWAGKRLPTEAEWEYAARGRRSQKPYVWGDHFCVDGKPMANTFQGQFPAKNTKEDGWERTSPVGSFPANDFGLYDMAGNVWNWCADWYRPDYYLHSPSENPTGPPDSYDPTEPDIPKRSMRGGSFLCTDQYCSRYMPGGRGKGAADTGSSHVGFRCVTSPKR